MAASTAPKRRESGLNEALGISIVQDTPDCVRMDMPVTDACLQPFGYVHGGATLTLLEAAASRGAELRCRQGAELPFGTHMDVAHVKSCRGGTVHGEAVFESQQDLGPRGTRQVWKVQARDDGGDVMSTGTFVTRIVPADMLAERQAGRQGGA